MKISELFEAKPNSVQVKNKSGSYKRFKSMSSPGVDEWARSYDEPKKEKLSPEQRRANREKEKQDAENQMRDIAWEAEMFMASALDGVDPDDKLSRLQRRLDIDMEDIDKAVKKYGSYKKDFYGSLAMMWSETQADHVHDAKNGHMDDNSQYYSVDKDGNVTPARNPWK